MLLDTTTETAASLAAAQTWWSSASVNAGQAPLHSGLGSTSVKYGAKMAMSRWLEREHSSYDVRLAPRRSIHSHVNTRYNSPIIAGDQYGRNSCSAAARMRCARTVLGTKTLVSHSARTPG